MTENKSKRIVLVRTHLTLSAGGPVPPLGLLYISDAILRYFGSRYKLKIIDCGFYKKTSRMLEDILSEKPEIVGFSSMSCESKLLSELAAGVKEDRKDIFTIAGGPHATLKKEKVLEGCNIDAAVTGEGESAMVKLLEALESGAGFEDISGLIYRAGENVIYNPAKDSQRIALKRISSEAYGLLDIDKYGNYKNWAGARRKKRYIAYLSSRGCPFSCDYCRSKDTFGQLFRPLAAEEVFEDILMLSEKYDINEIHFFDDVFNYDRQRVIDISNLFIKSGKKWHIVFPNGLRADLMDEELIEHLYRAGTYKIHYGIETAASRLQKLIKKNIDLEKVRDIIEKTSKKGIIVSGYFMLGFPSETEQETRQTIDYACSTLLDNAYFFKFTDFLNSNKYADPRDLNFYSGQVRTGSADRNLNQAVLIAQERFYLDKKRILRAFIKSPRKSEYISGLLNMLAYILQGKITRSLLSEPQKD